MKAPLKAHSNGIIRRTSLVVDSIHRGTSLDKQALSHRPTHTPPPITLLCRSALMSIIYTYACACIYHLFVYTYIYIHLSMYLALYMHTINIYIYIYIYIYPGTYIYICIYIGV